MSLHVSAHAHGHLLHQLASARSRASSLRSTRRLAPTAARLRAQAADLVDDLASFQEIGAVMNAPSRPTGVVSDGLGSCT